MWRADVSLGIARIAQLNALGYWIQRPVTDGAIEPGGSTIMLDADDNTVDMTLTPEENKYYMIGCVNDDNSVTITLDGSWTFNGTNNVATFTIGDSIVAFADGENEMLILLSNNGVVLS